MSKEIRIPTIQELEQAQNRRSGILEQRRVLFGKIGTGENQEATEANKATMLWEPTIKVGRARKAVSKSIGRLSGTQTNIGLEISSYNKAQEHLAAIAEEEELITKARQLVKEGYLPEAQIARGIKDHQARIEQAKNDLDIQRGLERMKKEHDQASKPNVQTEPPQEKRIEEIPYAGEQIKQEEIAQANLQPPAENTAVIVVNPAETLTPEQSTTTKIEPSDEIQTLISALSTAAAAILICKPIRNLGLTINEDTLNELIGYASDEQQIDNLENMTSDEINKAVKDSQIKSLKKAKKIIESGDFEQVADKIYSQNPNAWYLLIALSDLNKIEIDEKENQGISYVIELLNDPEKLERALETARTSDSIQTQMPPASVVMFKTGRADNNTTAHHQIPETKPKQSLYRLERRDPEIRARINIFLDEISANKQLNNSVSPGMLTNIYQRLNETTMDGLKKFLPLEHYQNDLKKIMFNNIAIATALYLHDYGKGVISNLREDAQYIVKEEVDRRMAEKQKAEKKQKAY